MTTEKIFIGNVKPGSFHDPTNWNINLKIFMSGSDVKKIIEYGKAGEATWKNDKGETMINFQIKTSQNGNMYMEIDQWKPQTQTPVEAAQVVTQTAVATEEEPDLPF